MGWYEKAAVNIYTAQKGVHNGRVKSELRALYKRVGSENLGGCREKLTSGRETMIRGDSEKTAKMVEKKINGQYVMVSTVLAVLWYALLYVLVVCTEYIPACIQYQQVLVCIQYRSLALAYFGLVWCMYSISIRANTYWFVLDMYLVCICIIMPKNTNTDQYIQIYIRIHTKQTLILTKNYKHTMYHYIL